jgi:hypothetical protein
MNASTVAPIKIFRGIRFAIPVSKDSACNAVGADCTRSSVDPKVHR